MTNAIITIDRLGKQYHSGEDKYYNIRDLIAAVPGWLWERHVLKKNRRKFWALKNVSFEIKKGEVLGIIGGNGAGKSTLLKILARIVSPTRGKIAIEGRVASMLEIGTGFNPELTGRENIFLNGAILGMSRSEIKRKFNDIVEFSEIGRFLDMPVKRYSSGMHVRLAFSVAAHLDPEILLVDEVLAVGDIGFQQKSLRKMRSIAEDEGRTIIFVSHNMAAVESLCHRVALLDRGRLVTLGEPGKIISKYVTNFNPSNPNQKRAKVRMGGSLIKIVDFWTEDVNRKRTTYIKSGDKCSFIFKYICPNGRGQKEVDVGFRVSSMTDQPLFLHYMSFTKQKLAECLPRGKFVFEFPKLPLAKGRYKVNVRVTVGGKEADYIEGVILVNVEDGDFYQVGSPTGQDHSPIHVEGHWGLRK